MMYRTFTLLALFFTLSHIVFGQLDWQLRPGPPGGLPPIVLNAAGIGECYALGYKRQVFRSTDYGQSWQRTAAADACADPDLFSQYGLGPDGLWYRHSGFDDYFVSTDSMRNWQPTAQEPAQYYIERKVSTSGTWVSQVCGNGLFRSVDQGAHWDTLVWLSFNEFKNLQYDAVGDAFYIRKDRQFWRSVDDGASWQNTAPALSTDEQVLQYQLSADDHLYALTDTIYQVLTPDMTYHTEHQLLVYRSDNGGDSWVRHLLPNFSNENLYDGLVVLSDGRLFVCATEYALRPYRSDNQGLTWSLADSSSWRPWGAVSLLPDGTLLGWRSDDDAYRSTDGGDTWALLTEGLQWGGVFDLLYFGSDTLLAAHSGGLMRSFDKGEHWSATNFNEDLFSMKKSGTNAYLANSTRLWYSPDRGESFQEIPLPRPTYHFYYYPHSSGWLFVSLSDTLFRTADIGQHWETLTPTSGDLPFMTAFPDGTLMFGQSYNFIQSNDLGLSWTNQFQPSSTSDFAIGANGVAYNLVYFPYKALRVSGDQGLSWVEKQVPYVGKLATTSSGALVIFGECDQIWISYDGGEQWESIDVPLNPWYCGQNPEGRLLLGAPGYGLWQSSTALSAPAAPTSPATFSISPNPVQQNAVISYAAPVSPGATWQLFDSMGRLRAECPLTGSSTDWLRGDLPAGFYFYRVKVGTTALCAGKIVLTD